MKPLLLVGGGGHCRSCIDVIERLGEFSIVGIVDRADMVGQSILGYDVIGCDDDLKELIRKYRNAMVTLGQIRDWRKRASLFERLNQLGAEMPAIVSPHSVVSRHAVIGRGSIVLHGAVVNSLARIGENCILNTGSVVEHDSVVGNHVHISTGAIVNGGCSIGSKSFVGSGAILREGISLPEESFVKAQELVKGNS